MVNGHFKHFPMQDSLRRRESSRAEPEPRKSCIHVIMVLITLSKTFLIQSVNHICRMWNKMPSFVLSPTQLWFFLITLTRDLTKLWRQQQQQRERERRKLSRFIWAKQQLCTCITLFCTFLSRPCTTATWTDQIFSWLDNGNGKARNFILSVWTRTRSPLFSSNLTSFFSSNWVTW